MGASLLFESSSCSSPPQEILANEAAWKAFSLSLSLSVALPYPPCRTTLVCLTPGFSVTVCLSCSAFLSFCVSPSLFPWLSLTVSVSGPCVSVPDRPPFSPHLSPVTRTHTGHKRKPQRWAGPAPARDPRAAGRPAPRPAGLLGSWPVLPPRVGAVWAAGGAGRGQPKKAGTGSFLQEFPALHTARGCPGSLTQIWCRAASGALRGLGGGI